MNRMRLILFLTMDTIHLFQKESFYYLLLTLLFNISRWACAHELDRIIHMPIHKTSKSKKEDTIVNTPKARFIITDVSLSASSEQFCQ